MGSLAMVYSSGTSSRVFMRVAVGWSELLLGETLLEVDSLTVSRSTDEANPTTPMDTSETTSSSPLEVVTTLGPPTLVTRDTTTVSDNGSDYTTGSNGQGEPTTVDTLTSTMVTTITETITTADTSKTNEITPVKVRFVT